MTAFKPSWATPIPPCNAKIDDEEEGPDLCVVCIERPPDLQLLPPVETICTWVRPEAPTCPLSRVAFHTMVLLA